MVREIRRDELQALLELYLHLHETDVPVMTEHLQKTWDTIIQDEDHHILVYEMDGRIVASCVCVIIPNLTRGIRPYAFLENVVTHAAYRGRGYATACLRRAVEIAGGHGCYKVMLLTGAKDEATLQFYAHAGFNSSDKTAFIHWL